MIFTGEKKPVLLAADDDALSRLLLQRIFSGKATLLCVDSGGSVLECLSKASSIDLILLDYHMPDMSGIDILRRIRTDARHANIPVVILTGDIDAGLEAEGFAAGATDFIRKPFIPTVVLQRVERVLRYEYLQKNLEEEVRHQTALAEQHLAESRLLFRQMVLALAKAIDAKDAYTRGHSERVADLAALLAECAGEDLNVQQKLYFMGLLHDIGKIGIPLGIINKTDRLTEAEYTTIKTHTTIGYEILQSIHVFEDLAVGAWCHHERFDGNGYPRGLKGEAIPRLARILAVADAYDAMTSERSYRAPLDGERVRKELLNGRGRQFDPLVVDHIFELIDGNKLQSLGKRNFV
ncbi:MAG: response regulator [Desulfovibrio sp.]|nr:response regulator [Desulfovibrio sp.]